MELGESPIAMPVRPITEQQFRTRRKDRRMVWVDAAAFLVGLLVLTVSVGGLIYVEPEIEPLTFEYGFFEEREWSKACAGFDGLAEGCSSTVYTRPAPVGLSVPFAFDPVIRANVTSVTLRLSWIDDSPIDEGPGDRDHGWVYTYDENATDTLKLVVTAPNGTTYEEQAANSVETKIGEILLIFTDLGIPTGGNVTAFSVPEAQAQLNATHFRPDHKSLGVWTAQVEVISAGDQNGTLPGDACASAPPGTIPPAAPNEVTENCYLHDNQDATEDGVPEVYRGAVSDYYASSFDDIGNTWILEFSVRHYFSVVSY